MKTCVNRNIFKELNKKLRNYIQNLKGKWIMNKIV
jgi:hypothetical protein